MDAIDGAVDNFAEQLKQLNMPSWMWDEAASALGSAFEGQTREAQATITNKIKGAINLFIRKAADNNAHVFPFFVRYALRLYDGSLIKHSPPILILPTRFTPFYAGPSNLAVVSENDTNTGNGASA